MTLKRCKVWTDASGKECFAEDPAGNWVEADKAFAQVETMEEIITELEEKVEAIKETQRRPRTSTPPQIKRWTLRGFMDEASRQRIPMRSRPNGDIIYKDTLVLRLDGTIQDGIGPLLTYKQAAERLGLI